MRFTHLTASLLVALVSATIACDCDIPTTKNYVSYRAVKPIILDGKVNDEAWEKVPWTNYFGNIAGADAPDAPSQISTRVKMMWDDQYYYVGAEMHEPIIRASSEKPVVGKPFDDNTISLYLDYDRSNQNYKVLQMNALGLYKSVILDKSPSQNGTEKLWDLGSEFKYKVYVNGKLNDPRWAPVDSGYWSVEWQIPLSKLSGKNLTKRGPNDVPAYSNMQYLRSGYPASSVVNLPQQPQTNTASLFFGIAPVNANTLLRRHDVGPKYQFTWTPQYSNDPNNPELWGSVMFRPTTNTSKPYVEDPVYYTRYALMQLYYAQMAYAQKNQGLYANTYAALGIDSKVIGKCTPTPKIKVFNNCTQFTASIKYRNQTGHINQDKLLSFTYN
ncbi:hypothetical protein K493DRAFT_339370 [Basidiobolus meristosporus CBS 931.73]|uniref:Carbohydrate-binding domain-containing protein n=1 Tax=Basidiobolus meristosporus CBS 931.73 TaxID=1314790 RepID=A0A1Y1Y081_9FUNG|nr:hypothetical protein K493DRAFT_339370 [Basidiobolus meristosporus CBS 931.73]|eukprot:ORX91411.1 hypothetical protein K493DRAFT_339370 [Basidiobolus meristosporus CBS 931.73]